MRGRYSINMVQDLVFVSKLSVAAKVCHRVRVSHWIAGPVALQESQALCRLWWEVLFDLKGVVDVNVPIFLLYVAYELV